MNLKITICPHGVDLRFAKCLMCDDPAFHAAQQPPVNVQTVTIGGHAPVLTKTVTISREDAEFAAFVLEQHAITKHADEVAARLRSALAAVEPKAPPCDLIPIVSPSAVCGLIGCTNQHVHTHDVREPVNRSGDA